MRSHFQFHDFTTVSETSSGHIKGWRVKKTVYKSADIIMHYYTINYCNEHGFSEDITDQLAWLAKVNYIIYITALYEKVSDKNNKLYYDILINLKDSRGLETDLIS